eukprot:COSAG02_NODE_37980_length_435_cov_0.627976_1_plen_93_part_10
MAWDSSISISLKRGRSLSDRVCWLICLGPSLISQEGPLAHTHAGRGDLRHDKVLHSDQDSDLVVDRRAGDADVSDYWSADGCGVRRADVPAQL